MNSHLITLCVAILTSVFLFSCHEEPTTDWEEIDLLSKGVPLKVHAPKDATVKESPGLFDKDVVISGGEDYKLQVFMTDAMNSNLASRVKDEKELIKEMDFFDEIVDSFENGFIFRMEFDSTTTSYDFRYLKITGDNEFLMQMGMGQIAEKDQVENVLKGIRMSEETKK